jgi:hypothetical protein
MKISARETFRQIILQDAIENDTAGYGREWYVRYLESCFREHFERHLLPNLPGLGQATLSVSSIGTENNEAVYQFLCALARHLLIYKRNITLFNIVDDLRNYSCNLFNENVDQIDIYELVVMAIGWLTMSMPHPISQPNDGSNYEGRGLFVNRQGLEDSCDQPLSRLLGKFKLFESMLDPPPLYKVNGQKHTSQYFMISTICFHTLREVEKIEIHWTEQLPLHLEFDRRRRTLTLFAFPSVSRSKLLNFTHANKPSSCECSVADSQTQF